MLMDSPASARTPSSAHNHQGIATLPPQGSQYPATGRGGPTTDRGGCDFQYPTTGRCGGRHARCHQYTASVQQSIDVALEDLVVARLAEEHKGHMGEVWARRLSAQMHAGLVGRLVALAVVAAQASGHAV